MTDTITHKGRTYTLAENVYSSTIDGNPTAYGYNLPGGQPTTWYSSRYSALKAAADDRSFVDIQTALPLDKPATAE